MIRDVDLFQRFPLNRRGRDFAVGDLHGCFSDLDGALRKVSFNPDTDRLFSVGDLIDRGPESDQCLAWLGQPWFHAVRGNHDQMMLDSWYSTSWATDWDANGNQWARTLDRDTRERFREAIDRLPIAIEVATPGGNVGIVHAGLNGYGWDELRGELLELGSELPEQPLLFWRAKGLLSHTLWARKEGEALIACFNGSGPSLPDVEGLRAVIMGHCAVGQPLHVGNRWLIDTGAGYRKPWSALTLLDLHTFVTHTFATQGRGEAVED